MFNVSDKVVCVDNGGGAFIRLPRPDLGATYVVRAIWETENSTHGWLIQLTGVDEVFNNYGERCGYRPSRFRKLTDIQAENAAKAEKKTASP